MPNLTALKFGIALFAAASGHACSAHGQSTVTYTYDARGRLVQSQHAGGRNDGVVVTQQYDPADNRTQQMVTGQSRKRVVVVPLNGFTVIPLKD